MNKEATEIITEIQAQVALLTSRFLALQGEHELLQQEKKDLKQYIEVQDDKLEQLNNQLRLLKLTKFAGNDQENERNEFKNTINEYIKELDNCIKLLNR